MQQRYYDPAIGRFLSVDPVAADGTSGGNFNRYWYANDNPYKFTDPDGRCAAPTGTRICKSLGAIKNMLVSYVAKQVVAAVNGAVEGVQKAVKKELSTHTYSGQVGYSATVAPPKVPGMQNLVPTSAVSVSANLAVSHRGQVSLTGSFVPMAGSGGGVAHGATFGVSRAEGGNAPVGPSITTNHHAEMTVPLGAWSASVGADWTSKGQSMQLGYGKFQEGSLVWLGAGEQVNATWTFNDPEE
jgi:hypothetical protein